MSDTVNFIVDGERGVELTFEQFPQRLHERLFSRIEVFTDRLEGAVLARVPRRTGALASDVVKSVRDSTDRIVGRVGVSADFAKVGALEYGAHGRAHVRSHDMRLDHVFSARLGEPLVVSVEAYSRQLDITAKRFMRGAKDDLDGDIQQGLREVVSETVDETAH